VGTVLNITVDDLNQWLKPHLASQALVPSVQEELSAWFEKHRVQLADTFRDIRREDLKKKEREAQGQVTEDSLIPLREIFDNLVIVKLVEFRCKDSKDVAFEELHDSLIRTSNGLLALCWLGVIDPYEHLPEDLSLSWPQVAGYLVTLKQSLPTQSSKRGPGRPPKSLENLLGVLVRGVFKGATGKPKYPDIEKIFAAAGFRELKGESLGRRLSRPDKKLGSKAGQKPS